MSKQIHYNLDPIDKIGATYNLIYGEKSNGKSWQVKHKKAVLKYLKTKKRFILLRRWLDDIKPQWIEKYFSDVDITGLTDGKYNFVTCYRKEIFFAYLDDNGKVKRGDKIGYAMSLSTEQHESGASYLDVEDIIFEEFMERGIYLAHESQKLMALYSTIDRKRGVVRLWLVGNTITRVNPYLRDWDLQKIVRRQKQGDINVIEIPTEDGSKVKLAIEYCKSSGGRTMTIGSSSKMIDSGAWQSFPQPHLPKSKNEYIIKYRFVFQYQDFRFLCELLIDKEDRSNIAWFISPKYTDIKPNTLVISDKISTSPWWQRDIYNLTIRNERLKEILSTFRESNIFYSDDLTGTDFKQLIDFSIRR